MSIISTALIMIVAFPKVVSKSAFGLTVADLRAYLPLAGIGMSWVVPALVGLVVGLLVHFIRRGNLPELVEE